MFLKASKNTMRSPVSRFLQKYNSVTYCNNITGADKKSLVLHYNVLTEDTKGGPHVRTRWVGRRHEWRKRRRRRRRIILRLRVFFLCVYNVKLALIEMCNVKRWWWTLKALLCLSVGGDAAFKNLDPPRVFFCLFACFLNVKDIHEFQQGRLQLGGWGWGCRLQSSTNPKGWSWRLWGDGVWGLMGPFCMTCRNTWMWSPDCPPPWPWPAEYKQGVSLRRWFKKIKSPSCHNGIEKK